MPKSTKECRAGCEVYADWKELEAANARLVSENHRIIKQRDVLTKKAESRDALLAMVKSISKHEDERRKANIGYDGAVDAVAKLAIRTVAAITGAKE